MAPRKTKHGFANAGRVVANAMRALHPDAVNYSDVEAQLDAALAANNAAEAAAARNRALDLLAKLACTDRFDARRSRAITQALRELGRSNAPIPPLMTRGAR